MKKSRSFLGVMILAVLLLSGAADVSAASTMDKIVRSGKMVIAVQTQGPPVSFVNRDGVRTGLAIEIARLMAEDMGVELVIQDYDWKGLIPALLSGKADLIAADMTPTAKRHMKVVFTQPMFYLENIAYAKKKRDFTSWKDLDQPGRSVGATQASSYADVARRFLPKARLKEYAGGNPQTFQAVVAGRVDAGISDRAFVSGALTENTDIEVLEGVISKEPLSFAVRPDSMHLLFALNNYVRLISLDGRLDKLVDYWWNSTAWTADHK
ncbi:MAG: amino acid ABC transporter substrate-binding protein [Proteobacteria bacterium]|nr:MAG: amino acid ABC transporter substrate-binding protein [Pseudomonadota bacterium]PIE64977.1 MAG: amino acid ABC transporter substrate-binding protein [Desulfobacterales bacterium]